MLNNYPFNLPIQGLPCSGVDKSQQRWSHLLRHVLERSFIIIYNMLAEAIFMIKNVFFSFGFDLNL